MSNKMDLSIFRKMMLSNTFEDISNEVKKFDNCNYHFYYDESNNIRKLWLRENDFNASVDSDFVLGGIMHINQQHKANVDELKNQLHLQKSAQELKFKHISTSKDFLDCLSEPKVQLFLKWLYHSDLYVHYSNINNLYYAIIDIIDSIDDSAFIPFNFQIKNELYKIAVTNYHDFYELLIKNNYPNIPVDNIVDFYKRLIDFVDGLGVMSFEAELLRQGLKRASKQTELVFLNNNPEKTIIDNYFQFYLRPIGVFSNSQHIFDNEFCVKNQFDKYNIFHGNKRADNYMFVDSKSSPLVQVSDCIVGLLGKYYTYINKIDIQEAFQMIEKLTPMQKSTLKLFAQILRKSEDVSKLLFCSIESREEHDVGAVIISNALNIN